MPTAALYPGSFDPITNGHLDIIERSIKIFDQVYVAVVQNPNKKTNFSVSDRIQMIQDATKKMSSHITVGHYEGLLVNLCEKEKIYTVIRGLRALTDFDYEFQMALTNRLLNNKVDSVLFVTSNRYSYVSSSLVNEIASYGGDVSRMVPASVNQKLIQKYNVPGGTYENL
jgi:pantetheine-phosphate adenylyltransferase